MDEFEQIDNPAEETDEQRRLRMEEELNSSGAPPPVDAPVAPQIPQLETPDATPPTPDLVPPTATPSAPPSMAMPTNGYSAGEKMGDKPPLPYLKEGDYPGKPFSWRTNILDPIARTLTFGAANPHGEENAYNKALTAAAAPGLGAGAAARQNTEAEILQSAKLLEQIGYDPATAHTEAVKFHTNPLQANADTAGATSLEAKRKGLVSRGGIPGALAEGASAADAATSTNQATSNTARNKSRLEQILAGLGGPGLQAADQVASISANTNQTGRQNALAQADFNQKQTLAPGNLANAQAAQTLEGAKTKTAQMQEGVDQTKIAGLVAALKNDPNALAEIVKEIVYGKDTTLGPGAAQIDPQTHQPIATNPIPLSAYYNTDPRTGLPVEHVTRGVLPPGMGQPQTFTPGQQIGGGGKIKVKLGPN